MSTYAFTLRLAGVPDDHEGFVDFSNAVYRPDIDLSVGMVGGVPEVRFEWAAGNLRDAISRAIAHIHASAPGVTVVGILLDDDQAIDEAFVDRPIPAAP